MSYHYTQEKLHLFKSPLKTPDPTHRGQSDRSSSGSSVPQYEKAGAVDNIPSSHSDDSQRGLRNRNNEQIRTLLEFNHDSEPPPIQLFYDLFFVANLTTFTNNHEITSLNSLGDYVGFFSILWFTWLQVALFDVRFCTDSIFERTCRAVQLGIMSGFAIIGTTFTPSESENSDFHWSTFKAFSLILMVSRVILLAQYTNLLWYLRHHPYRVPLLLTMASKLVSAVVYLGLFFGLQHDILSCLYGWYVISVAETVSDFLVACKWPGLGFKGNPGAPLVERITLLTLIILGEGVINMTKTLSIMFKGKGLLYQSILGQVVAGILIIYFLYMLYFDRKWTHHKVGTIREQLWTFMHFPLHVALILLLEGVGQLIIWRYFIMSLEPLLDFFWFPASPVDNPNGLLNNATQIISFPTFNNTVYALLTNYSSASVQLQITTLAALHDVGAEYAANNASDFEMLQTEAYQDLFNNVTAVVLDTFGIHVPDDADTDGHSALFPLLWVYDLYDMIYIYFFVSAGCALVVLALLYLFGKQAWAREEDHNEHVSSAGPSAEPATAIHGPNPTPVSAPAPPPAKPTHLARTRWWLHSFQVSDMIAVGVRLVAGFILAFLALWDLSASDAFIYYFSGPWMLPTVLLTFAAVVFLDHALPPLLGARNAPRAWRRPRVRLGRKKRRGQV